MMDESNHTADLIPADELAAILHALARSPHVRVTPIDVTGHRVWIKRYDLEPLAWAKRLHAFVSPMLFPAFLRNSAPAFGAAGVDRECDKIKAFAAAGFRTPRILHRSGAVLMLSDASPVLTDRLTEMDVIERRQLLTSVFETLGRVHSAGLVHGRPHLRDMSIRDGEICFFDFEEAPETAMPRADAQARDLWLLMLPLSELLLDTETLKQCLKTWVATAPEPAVCSFIRFLRFCRPLVAAAGRIPASWQGVDLKRFLAGVRFLTASISDMDSAIAASGPRPASKWVKS